MRTYIETTSQFYHKCLSNKIINFLKLGMIPMFTKLGMIPMFAKLGMIPMFTKLGMIPMFTKLGMVPMFTKFGMIPMFTKLGMIPMFTNIPVCLVNAVHIYLIRGLCKQMLFIICKKKLVFCQINITCMGNISYHGRLVMIHPLFLDSGGDDVSTA